MPLVDSLPFLPLQTSTSVKSSRGVQEQGSIIGGRKSRILHICFPPSCLPPPIAQSRADRRRCSPVFSANACAFRPAAAGGFGPGRGLCLRANRCIQSANVGLCASLSFSPLPRLQLMGKCPLEQSKLLFLSFFLGS